MFAACIKPHKYTIRIKVTYGIVLANMPSQTPTAFIFSATGSQGGALARQLRTLNWKVRATARDLESPAARALEAIGVQLIQSGWDDLEILKTALTGCDKLF